MTSREPKAIALLLADVDGTLVTHEKILTERAKSAVAALHAAGVRFAITSGRPPKGMRMVIDPLKIDTPVAGFNGGLFTDADLKTIKERLIPREIAQATIEMISDAGLDAWLYAGNDWFVHSRDAPHVDRESKTVQFQPTVRDTFDDLFDQAVKIVGVSDDHDRIRKCAAAVRERFGGDVTAALSQPYYLDVTHPDANKGAVVTELADRLGISKDQIATIGDMPNDISMFEQSGFAIAMGNGDEEVRAAADVSVADCDSEGFADAVETYILPNAKGRC